MSRLSLRCSVLGCSSAIFKSAPSARLFRAASAYFPRPISDSSFDWEVEMLPIPPPPASPCCWSDFRLIDHCAFFCSVGLNVARYPRYVSYQWSYSPDNLCTLQPLASRSKASHSKVLAPRGRVMAALRSMHPTTDHHRPGDPPGHDRRCTLCYLVFDKVHHPQRTSRRYCLSITFGRCFQGRWAMYAGRSRNASR